MCARCRAWRSWYWVRRRITLTRCSTNSRSRSLSGRVLGRPSTRASMITLKVSCSGEYSKSWFDDDVGVFALLDRDGDPHRLLAVAEVVDVGHAGDPAAVDQIGQLLEQHLLGELVGNLGEDDLGCGRP